MKNIYVTLLIVALLSGCGGVGAQQFDSIGIKIADEEMVKNCTFLGDVTGLSAFYGMFSSPAYSAARELAAKEAKKMGATHVVFVHGSSHYSGTEVFGRAYKCK